MTVFILQPQNTLNIQKLKMVYTYVFYIYIMTKHTKVVNTFVRVYR